MPDTPKGITLEDLDNEISLRGTRVITLVAKKECPLTRRLAVVQALDNFGSTTRDEKFTAVELADRFHNANGSVSIDSAESEMIKKSLEAAWRQPGIFVPLYNWMEGV